MPIRSFRAGDGVAWQVWNVVPGLHGTLERRVGYDRRSPEPVFRYVGTERRSNPERRKPSPFLSAHLASGWLTFESPTAKRRLTPIPQHWEEFSDAELDALCAQAQPVQPPRPPPGA